jgi:ATP-dependent RNA helicase DeaD
MVMTITFDSFHLGESVQRAIQDLGFQEPSPIQAMALPLLLEGRDVIGQAQTGTGKTAAFAIPIIERIQPLEKNIQAMVLCPTRELALQVAGEFQKLAKYKQGLQVVPVSRLSGRLSGLDSGLKWSSGLRDGSWI